LSKRTIFEAFANCLPVIRLHAVAANKEFGFAVIARFVAVEKHQARLRFGVADLGELMTMLKTQLARV
jgi:hypothetical protein